MNITGRENERVNDRSASIYLCEDLPAISLQHCSPWVVGSGCQLEAPNAGVLRLQIFGKGHTRIFTRGGQGIEATSRNEYGAVISTPHEYLTHPDVKEGPALGKEPR